MNALTGEVVFGGEGVDRKGRDKEWVPEKRGVMTATRDLLAASSCHNASTL